MPDERDALRAQLIADGRDAPDEVVIRLARRLTAVPSEYPPGDTHAIADAIVKMVEGVKGIEITRHQGAAHVMNLALRVKGASPGPPAYPQRSS